MIVIGHSFSCCWLSSCFSGGLVVFAPANLVLTRAIVDAADGCAYECPPGAGLLHPHAVRGRREHCLRCRQLHVLRCGLLMLCGAWPRPSLPGRARCPGLGAAPPEPRPQGGPASCCDAAGRAGWRRASGATCLQRRPTAWHACPHCTRSTCWRSYPRGCQSPPRWRSWRRVGTGAGRLRVTACLSAAE